MYIMMDESRLKREFTEENLTAWAEYRAEYHRANHYFKRDGWSEGVIFDWAPEKKECTLQLRWGNDHDNHENYVHYEELDELEYHRQFDAYIMSVKLKDFVS